jgi:hypothetical protein
LKQYPDLGFLLNPAPNPVPGFDKKEKKIPWGKKFKFLVENIFIVWPLSRTSKLGRRNLQPFKENIQHFKT